MAQTTKLTDLIAGYRLGAEIPDSISDADLITWFKRAARDLSNAAIEEALKDIVDDYIASRRASWLRQSR